MPGSRSPTQALPAASIETRLDEGVPGIVVLAGGERWFREEGLAAIVRRLLPSGDPGVSFLRYDARRAEDREGVSAAVDDVRSSSLFGGGGRVVAIDNPESAGGPWAAGRSSPVLTLAKAAAGTPAGGLPIFRDAPRDQSGSDPIPGMNSPGRSRFSKAKTRGPVLATVFGPAHVVA